jgi:hypothetical protein
MILAAGLMLAVSTTKDSQEQQGGKQWRARPAAG